jgi:outer membrane protein assembly factor BamB
MRRKEIAFSISVMLFLFSTFATSFPAGAADSHASPEFSGSRSVVDSWPSFRHDPEHTGQSASIGPNDDRTLWTYNTGSYWLGGVTSSPAVVDGVVYVGSKNSKVYALNASTGTPVWTYTTRDGVESSPAVVDGKVFIGSDDSNVYALNASTGAFIWSYKTGGYVISSPAVVDGLVFVGSKDGRVYALDEMAGGEVWNYTTGAIVDSSPAVSGGVVYVGSDDGGVYALHASTGICLWSYKTYTTGSTLYSSPAVADGKVFIGPSNDTIYALDASTGMLIWSYATGNFELVSYVFSSPAVAHDVVYVGAHNGVVYAFGSLVHDVAVTDVNSSQTLVRQGDDLNVAVTTADLGDYEETLNVTVYANSATVASQNVTLSSGDQATIIFAWNTTGFAYGDYIITAYVWPVPGETDTSDNTLSLPVHVGIADLAITDLPILNTIVGQNYSTPINVTAANQGDYSATSRITVYANVTVIATFENVALTNGNTTLAFTWNTTGFATGNYTMSAYVQPDPYETNTMNNNFTSPVTVMVGIPGDVVSPVGIVDMKDIAYVAKRFNIDPTNSLWDPNADFDGSGKIDMKDIAVVARNFGKRDS